MALAAASIVWFGEHIEHRTMGMVGGEAADVARILRRISNGDLFAPVQLRATSDA